MPGKSKGDPTPKVKPLSKKKKSSKK